MNRLSLFKEYKEDMARSRAGYSPYNIDGIFFNLIGIWYGKFLRTSDPSLKSNLVTADRNKQSV